METSCNRGKMSELQPKGVRERSIWPVHYHFYYARAFLRVMAVACRTLKAETE